MLPNAILQYYCSMHTLSPNIQIKPRMLLYTYRSSYTFSHTHTDQSIQSLLHIQSRAHISHPHIQGKLYNLHTHTKQSIYIPPTYRARHTIFHIPTDQSIRSTTRILPQTFCHKHVSQDIPLPTDTCYQSYSSRHTFSYGHLPAHIILPNRISVHMYWSLERRGHPRTQQHRYHSQSHLPWQTGLLASQRLTTRKRLSKSRLDVYAWLRH